MVRLLWSPSSPSSAALPLSLVGRGGGRKEMGGVWAEEGRRWLGDSLVRGHIELQRCCGAFLSPAGRGGEGRRCSGAAASTTPWWRFVLRRRATNAATAAISGREGGHSRRCHGVHLNLQRGGLSQRLAPESTPSHRQVVRPRRWQGGRRRSLRSGGEAQGPDCFFYFCPEVFSVNVLALSANLFGFRGLDAKCNPPTD